jgi:hypothetical protein
MTSQEVTYSADQWVCSDGSRLLLEATVQVFISDIQVTLTEAFNSFGGRVLYWQRTALIDWVACHQQTLRRLQPMYGEPGCEGVAA